MTARRWIALATLGALATTPSVAAAQTDGSSGIDALVSSQYELIISPPPAGLSTFSKARTYATSFDVAVTTTEGSAHLSLADGDVASGSKRGRLASGSKLLPLPLEARGGSKAFAPLALSVDTPLGNFTGPVTRSKTTVNLRQRVQKKAAGR